MKDASRAAAWPKYKVPACSDVGIDPRKGSTQDYEGAFENSFLNTDVAQINILRLTVVIEKFSFMTAAGLSTCIYSRLVVKIPSGFSIALWPCMKDYLSFIISYRSPMLR
jgi:hypothetical protein